MSLFTVGPEHHASQDASTEDGLRAIAAFVRINALSCIMSARHGWVGASFSAAEILTALYFGLGERKVVLSKGHAAAAQYACLFGLGEMSRAELLAYKDGPSAPQAHACRTTPGVLLDSGSLGQALSQVAGMLCAGARGRFYVVLGDGELQEGQVWEALQTVAHRRLLGVDVVIDRNGFQSARRVAETKGIADLGGALRGLGFQVFEVDGHDPLALVQLLEPPAGPRARVLIADTHKAGGSRLLVPRDGVQHWHGRVPDPGLYRSILGEQVALASDPGLTAGYRRHLAEGPPLGQAAKRASSRATRDGFGTGLETLLEEHPELCVLDADLADSCGLGTISDPAGRFARRGQFHQMGISEQDMVSFAGGMAVQGRLPVVSTYAAFMKRAVEQVHANLTMGARVIYAGHYAGLGYFTDGRSHQCLDDGMRFQGFPGLTLLEPAAAEQAEGMLDWAVKEAEGSVYLRLHRTARELPLGLLASRRGAALAPMVLAPNSKRCFVTTGPIATGLAIDCLAQADFSGWGLISPCAFGEPASLEPWRSLFEGKLEVFVIEESWAPGVLRPWLDDLLVRLRLSPVRGVLQPRGWGASFRSLEACLEHFSFTIAGVRALRAG